MKTIEYKGVKYAVTAGGLASDLFSYSEEFENSQSFKAAPPEDHVVRCMAWFKKYAIPQENVNRKVDSYKLKHVIEYGDKYVINGAAIEAALRLGFDVVPCGEDSPNAYFRLMFDLEPFDRAGRHFASKRGFYGFAPKRGFCGFNGVKILSQKFR